MVETAIFSIFHRPPPLEPTQRPAEPPPPAPPPSIATLITAAANRPAETPAEPEIAAADHPSAETIATPDPVEPPDVLAAHDLPPAAEPDAGPTVRIPGSDTDMTMSEEATEPSRQDAHHASDTPTPHATVMPGLDPGIHAVPHDTSPAASPPLAPYEPPGTDAGIVPDAEAAQEASEPEAEGPPAIVQIGDEMFLSGIDADHELIGLANPDVFVVQASYAGGDAIALNADRTGIYRPEGFRAAPWSGFAYDQSPDGRTGVAVGTRILTTRGEVPVETLLPGDVALALRGPALLPITWVGRSDATEPSVVIEEGALGPNRPRRTLRLAADHPVFIDPVPVPARQLVNGTTITTAATGRTELFHIDVGAAEILFAEGIPLSSTQRPGVHPAS